MTLNTYVAGNLESGEAMADFMTQRSQSVDEKAAGWHRGRAKAEREWEGPAAEAFVANRANPNGRDGDVLAAVDHSLAAPYIGWSEGIRSVNGWMERAKQIASNGGLIVHEYVILPPPELTANPPTPLEGRASATDSAAHAQAQQAFATAKALQVKKEAAYTEALAIVRQARELERNTHNELRKALSAGTNEIKDLGQFEE